MDRTERFHLIDQMLCNNRFVRREKFLQQLEVSAATFKRDLEYLRERLGAPIIWDREYRGYRYDQTADPQNFQLPGMWFNTSEIQALLSMDVLLQNIQPGMLSEHIEPLRSRIRMLLDKGDHAVDEIARRIRILPLAAKAYSGDHFQAVCQALLSRKCIELDYYSRHSATSNRRKISPQRLIYYRDNWYLDAWCHLRKGLRSFSLDAIQAVEISSDGAKEIIESELERELASGYGIFSGASTDVAKLKFNPQTARWVSQETWHQQQKGIFDANGFYHLSVPYSQDTELLMDILKYGDAVEVLEPKELRSEVKLRIEAMRQLYS